MGRSMLITIGGNAVSSIGWLISGLLAARLLGPTGRGELAAIQMWGALFSIFAALGMSDALIYFVARDPAQGGAFAGSAVLLSLLGCVPLLSLGYFAMPALLAAQSPLIVSAARLYLLMGIAYAIAQVPLAALVGRHDFVTWNALRIFGSICWLIPLLLAWTLHRASAE